MSKSNSIINQHSPMSLCLYYRNCHHLLWLGSEKEDLINQSSLSFILLIINSFDSIVYTSPQRVCDPRMMDWSFVRSDLWFIQSFILSNTIEWQSPNAAWQLPDPEQHNLLPFNWMDMREGRLESLNDLLPSPIFLLITIDSTEREICSISLTFDIQNTDGWRDRKCSEGVTLLFLVM